MSRFDDRFLDEIKSRLRLSDVIGRTVKLKRQGREYAGLSPFSKEKSPSFFVNDDKGFFHCFSSGKHGDLLDFIQETERLSFVEAVEQLAQMAGVPMPAADPEAIAEERHRRGLADWLDLALQWYEGELRRPGGMEARAYLERRGLPQAEWARFQLGFAPASRTALKDYLIAKGARVSDLVESGLLIAPEDGTVPYDRFRSRIMFPILDPRGRIISFGGRALDPAAKAKYLNGPDTPLFDKGRALYGMSDARKIIATAPADSAPPLVVVEGYMDVIACQRSKIAAVAPMGTALTEGQMDLLWRHHPEPTLFFDADGAGARAAGRVIERALPHLRPGKSFQFAAPEGGKDADDIVREHGPAVLRAQIAKTTPFVDRLFRILMADAGDLRTPERRTAFRGSLMRAAGAIEDRGLGGAYREELLRRYSALWPAQAGRRQANGRPGMLLGAGEPAKAAARAMQEAPRPLAAALAMAAVDHPDFAAERAEMLADHGFGDRRLDRVADVLISLSVDQGDADPAEVRRRLQAVGMGDELFAQMGRAAAKAKALFMDPATPPDRARVLWAAAYEALAALESLERAVVSAKESGDFVALPKLKSERDVAAKVISDGSWALN